MTEVIIEQLAQRAPELLIIAGMLFILLKAINRVVTQLVSTSNSIQGLHRDTLKIVEKNTTAMSDHNNLIKEIISSKREVVTELGVTSKELQKVTQALIYRCNRDPHQEGDTQ